MHVQADMIPAGRVKLTYISFRPQLLTALNFIWPSMQPLTIYIQRDIYAV